jgi:hypothetical protein
MRNASAVAVPLVGFLLRVCPRNRPDGLTELARQHASSALEERLFRELRNLARRQLFRPRDASGWIGSGPCRLVLGKPRSLFASRIAPVIQPSGLMCLSNHVSMKTHSSIRTPRPAEIDSFAGVLARQTAMHEDEPRVLLVAGPIVCRHIAVAFAVNRAVLKDRRRAAENEIDVSFDVAVLKKWRLP